MENLLGNDDTQNQTIQVTLRLNDPSKCFLRVELHCHGPLTERQCKFTVQVALRFTGGQEVNAIFLLLCSVRFDGGDGSGRDRFSHGHDVDPCRGFPAEGH